MKDEHKILQNMKEEWAEQTVDDMDLDTVCGIAYENVLDHVSKMNEEEFRNHIEGEE